MNQEADVLRQRMRTPRAAAVAGILFSLLLMTSFLLVRISVPANPLSQASGFAEQRAHSFDVWQDPFVTLRVPKLFNLRGDPFEQADHNGIDYPHWRIDRVFLLVPAQGLVAKFLATFKDYPPRQKTGSFNLDQVLQSLISTPGEYAN